MDKIDCPCVSPRAQLTQNKAARKRGRKTEREREKHSQTTPDSRELG